MPDAPTLPSSHIDKSGSNIKLWLEEAIWGHRLYDDQTPWLAMLEFLNVFRSRMALGKALREEYGPERHEDIVYDMERMRAVRYLVFNNPYMRQVEQSVVSDGERWKRWLEHVGDNALKVDFGYLKKRFNDFSELCRVVEFFQETAVQVQTNKRWTSRFIFPYGPDCLYADLDGVGEMLGSNDRRFFARGGEILYLMMNRSTRAAAVADAIRGKLLDGTNRWNRLVKVLLRDGHGQQREQVSSVKAGYLPCIGLVDYDRLADDWLAVLSLGLPGQGLVDPLVRLTGLSVVLYMLGRARSVTGESEGRLVLEIAAPRRSPILDLSKDNFDSNRNAPLRAIERRMLDVRGMQAWKDAVVDKHDPKQAALKILAAEFHWNPPQADSAQFATPAAALSAMEEAARKRHGQHFAKVLPNWSRAIGLATARRSVGTWYSPSDPLIKALVMANVPRQEEFNIFLTKLFDRYGIVIGVAEAERSFGSLPVDAQAFRDNAERLEHRMRALGLVRRLSDDCAYVINPFAGEPQ